MENFSTSPAAMVPHVANLATLAVVVAATWWSSGQRPVDRPTMDAAAAATVTVGALQAPATTTGTAAPHAKALAWPTQTAALPRDAMQPVGYQVSAQR